MKVDLTALLLPVALFLSITQAVAAMTHWEMTNSDLTYQIDHPLKSAKGVSHSARGKGECDEAGCKLLVAVPVKSFDSGDSNRDLHMLEVTRGAANPLIVVDISAHEPLVGDSAQMKVDLVIDFAGKKVKYPAVPFDREKKGSTTLALHGVVPLKLEDFDIRRPSLLAMPVKNEVPVTVNSTWIRK